MNIQTAINDTRVLFSSSELSEWGTDGAVKLEAVKPIPLKILTSLKDFGVNVSFFEDAVWQKKLDKEEDAECPILHKLLLILPRNPDRFVVAKDLTDLMSIPAALMREPSAYVIYNSGIIISHIKGDPLSDANEKVVQYHDALRLWAVLKSMADYAEVSGRLIFLGSSRVDIKPHYKIDDLCPTSVGDIEAFCNHSDRKDVRKEIVKSRIISLTKDVGERDRFAVILKCSSLLVRQLGEGLAMYITENSPSKLIQECEKKVLEFSEKIDKAISAMETKTLAVPAAILLSFKELKVGAGLEVLNFVVLASYVIFASVMWWTTCTQRIVLKQLEKQLADKRMELKRMGLSPQNDAIRHNFGPLERRVDQGLSAVTFIRVGTVIPLIFLLVFMFFKAP